MASNQISVKHRIQASRISRLSCSPFARTLAGVFSSSKTAPAKSTQCVPAPTPLASAASSVVLCATRTYMHWTAVSGFKAARVAQQGQLSTRGISYFRLSAGCRQFRS